MAEHLRISRHYCNVFGNDTLEDDDETCWQIVDGACLDGVPGAVLISQVLSPAECDQLIKLTESAGYHPDGPMGIVLHDRYVRQNDSCVLIASEAFNKLLFDRCSGSLPLECGGGELCGINRRWRFYKYHPGDIFRAHVDPGGLTGGGFDESGTLIPDSFGDRKSQMTFLLFLNDEFDGGATRFFVDPVMPRFGSVEQCSRIVSVPPSQGSVLCFFHGNHQFSPWHEGQELAAGT
eukprot:gnl/MRDRNA2_/MRDRNA2_235285_c0_seq1.p1 gnl/MRDRNA2_/MRDRNA2_235285_c0~~gnl/MRDRNA2_/MRDRNA2_235285_c0_seq1.p1  ORF type:complete len:259 (+),score=42.31 gnl/MRDRNA2_/MRDRNA2_235285_c0_seq1:74-778(+)